MHEFALADAVVKAALQAAADGGIDRLHRVVIRVGELQQIRRELFEHSLTEVIPASDDRLSGVEFDVTIEPVRFRCRTCGHEYGRADVDLADPGDAEAVHFIPELAYAYTRCPACGGPDFEILQGRGVVLASIEGCGGDD